MDAPSSAATRSWFLRVLCATATVVSLLAAAPAAANLLITVGSATAASPSSGNTLEVDLVNTGVVSISLAAFAFTISVGDSHITFTSATINTASPYVFAGNSLLGPAISTSAPGQTLVASDVWSGVGAATIGAGATVGLGHVLFDVSPGDVSGPVTVALTAFPGTDLFDANGNSVVIDGLVSGSITIAGLVVAEPSPVALVLIGFMALAVAMSSRRTPGAT